MPLLRAHLFETLRLYAGDGGPLDLGSPKTRSLIAYLLLNRAHPIDRRKLAYTFWPNSSEAAARRNLRQYLYHAKAALTPADPDGEPLHITNTSIQFNPQLSLELDVELFLHKARPQASLEELLEAIELYTSDLLEDIYDDWCIAERERLRKTWLAALDRSSQILQAAERDAEAIAILETWAQAEPFQETAHQRLITLYARRGERTRALQTYQHFARRLAKELNADPLPETQALIQAIQEGQRTPARAPISPPAAPTRWKEAQDATGAIPFIGRREELDTLNRVYQQASGGAGRLVLISGEAGIGKTRLLQEYLHTHPAVEALHSTCYELDSMIPFAPLRQALQNSTLLEQIFQTRLPPAWSAPLRPILPELQRFFPYQLPDEHAGASVALRESLTNFILYLSAATPRAPLHIILDDLHWADTSTWELIAALVRFAPTHPLVLIGLFRREDFPAERRSLLRSIQRADALLTLDLPRLTPAETEDLARHLNPTRAKNSIFIQRLYQDTEGNPFFIIETIRVLQESGVQSLKALTPSTIPHSIQRVIEARLDRLPPPSREALGCAAAIGRSFTFPLLQEILEAPQEAIITFIEEWQQRGLVHESARGYDFRHDKFRQVAYGSLSRARREYIHGRIAAVLENAIPPADATTLAHHYARSNHPLKALPFLTQAGEHALQLRSYHEVRQFGLQAVSLLGQLPGPRQRGERVDINLQLAQAYAFTGDLQRAIEILNESEHLATSLNDEKRLGQIFRRAAQFFWLSGQSKTASDYARRALRVAEETENQHLLGAALRMLGRVSIALAAFDDAIAYLLRYVNMHAGLGEERAYPSMPADMPIVLGYLGVAYSRVGAWQRAFSVSQQGCALAESLSENPLDARNIFARMQLAMVRAAYHDWGGCLEALAPLPKPESLEEITPPLFMALGLRGYAQAQSGAPARGLQITRKAVDWAAQTGYHVFAYLPRIFLAEESLLAGDIPTALKQAQQALQEAQQAADRWATGISLRLIADIRARFPKPPWAQIENDLIASMHLLRQIRARPDLARTYLSLRRLYDRAGQIAWAVDCHFRAITIFEELGMNAELQLAQGQAAHERQGAVVIVNLPLQGPNQPVPNPRGDAEANAAIST